MKIRNIMPVLLIAIVAVGMLTTVLANDQFVDAASKKVKITYNANGGKIGSKKTVSTSINKGNKLKKFPSTPKRTGYTFNGWFTKKTGGKKVTVKTKATKKITLHAQWKKITSASKIVGNWKWEGQEYSPSDIYGNKHLVKETMIYNFFADGTFNFFDMSGAYTPEKFVGKYSISNGKVYIKNMKWYKLSGTTEQNIAKFGLNYRKWNWGLVRESNNVMTTKFKFASDSSGSYLEIAYPRLDADLNHIYPGEKFYKA